MAEIELNIDKELDLLTAIVGDSNLTNSHLEVKEIDDNILFHINPLTNELIRIQIYDFSIVRRRLIKHLRLLKNIVCHFDPERSEGEKSFPRDLKESATSGDFDKISLRRSPLDSRSRFDSMSDRGESLLPAKPFLWKK